MTSNVQSTIEREEAVGRASRMSRVLLSGRRPDALFIVVRVLAKMVFGLFLFLWFSWSEHKKAMHAFSMS